jgi:hypothetical protein
MLPFLTFFRFIRRKEKILLGVGTASAVCAGLLMPSIAIVMGDIANAFDPSNGVKETLIIMKVVALYCTCIGIG